ncbi:homocysteine-responsive endoplasmic reticulum-resident ubiquitin-like domain member 2 protein [Ischnura elegans]|uniref:homocysteine-responsive endoplasmic reticulum-resident ubiquitin-like domain member 2 protein n=1 Tax=Ischnura elegans TaxID=197161 RepID=UPI001ED8728B|nr:homocysteine-responsive endoplasmic reticulum-resident ubiquitin-like domain member 2 protein [Ischnura elegans]XP_046398482.1 homocysteine-responsive endoplasmic reticulum-resident ubiquitin-like domain member 2 protein [Ischnura elegans]
MESMEMPVTLIVKAPNQQIEDQTIQCQLNWTVHKLKSHLSEVYPSKPRTEEQKLIYSGHLLHDSSTLKEVLRRYEGQDDGPSTHTLHLVCSASSPPQCSSSTSNKTPPVARDSVPTNGSSSGGPTVGNQVQDNNSAANEEVSRDEVSRDGLRHRFTSEGQAEVEGGFSVGGGMFINPWAAWAMQTTEGMEQIGMSSSSQQQWQMQWMQQAYAQYLAQYMQLVQSGAAPQGFFVPTPFGAGMSSDGSGFNNSESSGPGTPVFTPPLNNNNNEPAAQDAGADRGDDADALGADGLPPGQNRDWIDWIYFGSRFMVFLSIIYFYSTLARVLLVTGIGMAMYLWKVGFFRLQQPPVPNGQRDPVRDADVRDPPPNNADDWNQRPAERGAEAAPDVNNATAEREGAARSEDEEARVNRGHPAVEEIEAPTIWAVTWTFLTSFFTSLIPDSPNAI